MICAIFSFLNVHHDHLGSLGNAHLIWDHLKLSWIIQRHYNIMTYKGSFVLFFSSISNRSWRIVVDHSKIFMTIYTRMGSFILDIACQAGFIKCMSDIYILVAFAPAWVWKFLLGIINPNVLNPRIFLCVFLLQMGMCMLDVWVYTILVQIYEKNIQ